MAYASLSDLKTYIATSNQSVGDNDNTILSVCLTRAQAWIDGYTGTTFEASADTTRYFDAVMDTIERELHLDQYLCSVTTVTINGTATTDYITVPRNSTPYYTLKLTSSSSDSWLDYGDEPEDAIAVTGKWAYSTSAPDDIVQTTLRLAAYFYRQRHYGSETDRPIITGGTTILPSVFPSDVMKVLDYYAFRSGRG